MYETKTSETSETSEKKDESKKYHFFVPDGDEIIHWANTLKEFRKAVKCKLEDMPESVFSRDPHCRVLDLVTMQAKDMWLSEIMADDF